MQNDMLSVLALPDEQTAQFILSLRSWLWQQGFPPDRQVLPPHVLLSGYPAAAAQDVLRLTAEAAAKTRSFSFNYTHVGVAPVITSDGATVLLAPEINRPMLTLRERFVHSQSYLLHTPLLNVPPELLPQVLPYVLTNVKPMTARISALAVYRQDGTQLALHRL